MPTLGEEAMWEDLIPIPDHLKQMAARLAELPYAAAAATETAAVIADLQSANARAHRLAEVWHAVERCDRGDGQGEVDVLEAVSAYRASPLHVKVMPGVWVPYAAELVAEETGQPVEEIRRLYGDTVLVRPGLTQPELRPGGPGPTLAEVEDARRIVRNALTPEDNQ